MLIICYNNFNKEKSADQKQKKKGEVNGKKKNSGELRVAKS